MKILLISTAFNSLCQRVHRELHLMGHNISVELAVSSASMQEAAQLFQPDLVICPFLTKRIPETLWRKYTCLIVHPGIEGDRGPSSIDWAISNNRSTWGVTVLQASQDMDAGDIWATGQFILRKAKKSSIYRREVTQKAVELIKIAINNYQDKTFKPRPLDYTNPQVFGKCLPLMKQQDRKINWQKDDTDTVIKKINASDSMPGLLDTILSTQVYLYGATREQFLVGHPGEIIIQKQGAICRATKDGAVWIKQLKLVTNQQSKLGLKLPASQVLNTITDKINKQIPTCNISNQSADDIQVYSVNQVAYVHFNFNAGALNTQQCNQLRDTLINVKQQPVKMIVLMGGEDFWANGIHLHCIEASNNPAQTAWENIQAIDDLVLEIINSPNQVTVAALRNNAGAGGAMMALACDKVIVRQGVVLNPHYKSMHLFGSEYWTYLLPKRVGELQAEKLTNECLPIISTEAVTLNFADKEFDEDWTSYQVKLVKYCESLISQKQYLHILNTKNNQRKTDEAEKPLANYRAEELQKMRECFFNAESKFHQARYEFVYKVAPKATPPCLAIHRQQSSAQEHNRLTA